MGIIRSLLAICVLFGHNGSPILREYLIGGTTAVQIFYVISGFYMAMVLNEKYLKDKPLSRSAWTAFIQSRILRLYPTYLIVLVLTLIFTLCCRDGEWFRDFSIMKQSTVLELLIVNITVIGQDIMTFMGFDPQSGGLYFSNNLAATPIGAYRFLLIPQAWTLGLEMTFYLLAPFVVRRRLWFIISLMFVSLSLRAMLYHIGLNHDPWTYRFFPCELFFFLTGVLLYRLYRRMPLSRPSMKKWCFGAQLCAILGILVWRALSVTLNVDIWKISKMPFAFVIVVACIPWVFHFTKNSRIDRVIGDLSYPIYISHILVIGVLSYLHVANGLSVLLSTIAFSGILMLFVDKRMYAYRQRIIEKHVRNVAMAKLAYSPA